MFICRDMFAHRVESARAKWSERAGGRMMASLGERLNHDRLLPAARRGLICNFRCSPKSVSSPLQIFPFALSFCHISLSLSVLPLAHPSQVLHVLHIDTGAVVACSPSRSLSCCLPPSLPPFARRGSRGRQLALGITFLLLLLLLLQPPQMPSPPPPRWSYTPLGSTLRQQQQQRRRRRRRTWEKSRTATNPNTDSGGEARAENGGGLLPL